MAKSREEVAMNRIAAAVLVASSFALAPFAAVAAPGISLQGALKSQAGGPAADGKYTLVVRVYESAVAAKEVWKEIELAVPVQGGLFALVAGGAASEVPIPADFFSKYPAAWVGVQIPDEPELPRAPLHAVPYAYHALKAGDAATAAKAAAIDCAGCVKAQHVEFSFAGAESKGGAAMDLQCSGCVEAKDLADGAVQNAHVGFNYAASDQKGGAALSAKAATKAEVADLAKDLQCTGCVGFDELGKDVLGKLLAPATANSLGGVLVGSGLDVKGDGTLSVKSGAFLGSDGGTVKKLFVEGDPQNGLGLRVGALDVPCGQAIGGTLRWTGTNLEICNGTGWVALYTVKNGKSQAQAATSCADILSGLPGAKDGVYWLDPNGGATSDAFEAWCDMTIDGGGWALAYVIINGVASPAGTGPVNPQHLLAAQPTQPGKFSDATITALAKSSEYRYACGSLDKYKRYFLLTHPFANQPSLVVTGDKCRTSMSVGWTSVSSGGSSTNVGLASTPNGDGCGPCADLCGGGGNSGFWNSWKDYFPTTSSNGCYSAATSYTNGYMWVR
jgi:hypothetical protein